MHDPLFLPDCAGHLLEEACPFQRRAYFGAEDKGQQAQSRLDLANLHIQRYGDTAIASYTLLISTALPEGVKVAAHNESRVIVKLNGEWKVVHVHKSPAYPAPHVGSE